MKNNQKLQLQRLILSKCELESLLEESSKKGAKIALSELGLHDDNASNDIKDLRELLQALRLAKKDSFRILIKYLLVGAMTLIAAGFISIISK